MFACCIKKDRKELTLEEEASGYQAKMTSETDQGSVDLDDMTNDDDDLLGDTVELSAFEIDRLLDDEDEDIQPATENGDVDEGGSSDQAEKTDGNEERERRSSESQGSRPHRGNRMFRGGGPRFFYPMGMPRGMMPPPFGMFRPGRPPFGAMRPMPPPHMMRMAMMRAAQFGPMCMRPRMMRDEKPEVSKSKPEAPKPLMSIQTHDARDLLRGRESQVPLGMGLGSRYQPRTGRSDVDPLPRSRPIQRDSNRPMKRPGPNFQDETRTKVFNTGRTFQQVPRYGDQGGPSSGPPPNRIQKQSFVVAHKPAPNLTQIQLTPAPASTSQVNIRGGTKVRLSNLPRTANFSEITALTTSCGTVRNLNVSRETNSAIIEFESPMSVDNFVAAYNNTILGNHLLSATRIG